MQALTLIERCSDAFRNDKDLSAVGEAYQYLKSQNVQFPPQNLDDMVAIHTPRAVSKLELTVVKVAISYRLLYGIPFKIPL